MATSQTSKVIQHLRKAVFRRDGAAMTDGELLGCFIERRDDAAFAVLMRRHAPMVWGVCRRLLDHHDAEDAFQAAFLVLARKAASVMPREMVANWLYGVARQAALQARRTAARRRERERQVTEMPEPAAATQDLSDELPVLLDQELSRLPNKYRVVIVLCDLEGKSRREAAEQLGVPEGTVASRHSRAKAMLAKRLARRVASPSAVVSSAPVPAKLVLSAAQTAGVGRANPASVTALAEGVIKAMQLTKLAIVGTLLLGLAVVAGGSRPPPAPRVGRGFRIHIRRCPPLALGDATDRDGGETKADVKKDDETAWGEAVGGLQAGVAFSKGGRRAYRIGETVPLVVRLRNVTDKALAFDYADGFFVENPPAVTDAAGKPARLSQFFELDGIWRRLHLSVEAGQTVEFGSLDLALAPADAKDRTGKPTLFAAPGSYHIQYKRMPPLRDIDPTKVLSTGKLDLEVKEADPPAGAKGDLEGSWQAVSFEQDSRTPRDVNVKEVAATFEGDKYRFTTGMRVQGAGKGTLAVHPDTDPKTFEFTPDSGVFEGQAFRGVYRLDGDRLTLCFSWPVKDRPTEFASPPNSTVVLAVFERRKP